MFLRDQCSPELQLLLSCSRLNPDADELAETRRRLSSSIQWESIPNLARHHGVASLAFHALGEDANVPTSVRERIREFARQNALHSLRLIHELICLHELCCQEDIALMPYKGPALSAVIYGDTCIRDTSDLDLLIHPQDLPRLTRLLLARGYVPEQGIPSDFDSHYFQAVSEFGFAHPKTGIRIDAHWNIAPRHLGMRIDPEWFWDGASQVGLNGVTMPTMRAEKLILALCIHGTKHAWERLKWICDVGNLLRADPDLDWPEISNAAFQSGAERALALGLWMAHHLLATPLPPGYRFDASTERLAQHCIAILQNAVTDQSSSRRRWLFLWQLQSGWVNKLQAVKWLLTEPEIGADQPPLSSALSMASCRRALRAATVMIRN